MLSIIVFAVLTAAPLFAQPSGSLLGCVTDVGGQRLPHVTVVVRTERTQQTLETNTEGCYEAKALPPNVYRVTTLLAGFDNETPEKVRIEPGSTVRLDIQMQISSICECLAPPTTLRERWERADAILHLRISHYDNALPVQRGFFGHTAEVLEVLKRHPSEGPTDVAITFLQGQSSGQPLPYDAGDELIVFLVRSPTAQTFLHHQHTGSVFDARTDAGLKAELRALSVGK
jgi:hypothetical protein